MRGRAGGSEAEAPLGDELVLHLRSSLLAWYERERRPLPWREDRDPYRVWISEAMLQQTRVEAVLEPYRRFLAHFPDLEALAAAPEERVLEAWSGLGYYRRARSLHAAARALVSLHGGRFPSQAHELRGLPGIGRYTAGAIASIAFGRREALVDGNVARVLARLFALDEPPGAALERRTWRRAGELVPAEAPGEWNQALMELGATVCLPRAPRCDRCPLAARCRAQAEGRAGELPRPRPRPATLAVALEIAWIERDGRALFVRRPDGGRMAGLWEPPTRELGLPPRLWPTTFRVPEPGAGAAELALELEKPLGELVHAITRHRIRALVRRARLREPGQRSPAEGPAAAARAASLAWLALEPAERGWTGLARKACALARARREPGRLFA